MRKINRSLRVLVLTVIVLAAFLVTACDFTPGGGSAPDQGQRQDNTQQVKRQQTLQETLQRASDRRREEEKLLARLAGKGDGNTNYR